jgi:hypothetical protein
MLQDGCVQYTGCRWVCIFTIVYLITPLVSSNSSFMKKYEYIITPKNHCQLRQGRGQLRQGRGWQCITVSYCYIHPMILMDQWLFDLFYSVIRLENTVKTNTVYIGVKHMLQDGCVQYTGCRWVCIFTIVYLITSLVSSNCPCICNNKQRNFVIKEIILIILKQIFIDWMVKALIPYIHAN